MLKGKTIKQAESLVLVSKQSGITVIPSPTPLTRLHYFDGKFLRARDLELEQTYLRQLVALSNQAGGAGVVHGFSCGLEGNRLSLGPGLAIDGQGRVLLLPEARDFDLAALIAASRQRYADSLPKPIPFPGGFGPCCDAGVDEEGTTSNGASLYLISICHAEALCGEEDVFGKLCAAACTTSTERPFTLEGVALLARPLELGSLLPTSTASPVTIAGQHLRSRVAAAFFEDERRNGGSLIAEGGLASAVWCQGAAAAGAGCVPLAVVARAGSQTLFLDSWTARRERIETPPRRYWAGILAMRPWDVYLAQVLQFQCQLACCLAQHPPEDSDDPCQEAYQLLRQTAEELAAMIRAIEPVRAEALGGKRIDYQQLEKIRGRLADKASTASRQPRANRLLHCGFVELPSAGYLPVDPGAQQTVNEQVRSMMGDSVDLRFCVVRPDYVPHAFEEAQHMERISLLHGFDHPADKPKVDILVPNGQIEERLGKIPGEGYIFELKVLGDLIDGLRELAHPNNNPLQGPESTASHLDLITRTLAGHEVDPNPFLNARKSATDRADGVGSQTDPTFFGAARGELKTGGSLHFYYAGHNVAAPAANIGRGSNAVASWRIWLASGLAVDPFELEINETTSLDVELVLAEERDGKLDLLQVRCVATLTAAFRSESNGATRLGLRLTGSLAIQHQRSAEGTRSAVVPIQESLVVDRKPGSGFGTTHAVSVEGFKLFGEIFHLRAEHTLPTAGRALLTIGVEAKDSQLEIVQGQRQSSADALQAGHTAHAASLTALAAIGLGLDDASFADTRARLLFPPVKAGPKELILRARLPWVLFHRRRDKICATDVPEGQVVARKFRLFHIELTDRAELETLRELLEKGSGLANYNPQFVATVEFAAGLASVQNTYQALQDSWDLETTDGSKLVFGAIAGQGQVLNEGGVLAEARLGALAGVLAPVTPSDTPEYTLLDAIHPDLPANGLDGSIVYATVKTAVSTECQSVYVLRRALPSSAFSELAKSISISGFNKNEIEGRFEGIELDKLLFESGTAKALAGNLDALAALLKSKVPNLALDSYSILTVSREGSTAADQSVHEARSKALLERLQGPDLIPGVINGTRIPLPFACPALSLLAVLVG